MRNGLKMLGIAAALAVGSSSAVFAQACPPGYGLYGGMCRPMGGAYAPNNPVSGAAVGAANGAAEGNAVAGPVGGIVGGALGTASGALAGTANAVAGAPVAPIGTPAPVCPPGRTPYQGYCY